MSWKVWHEGSPQAVDGLSVAQIVEGWHPVTQISSSEKWTIQDLAAGRDRLFRDRDPGVPPFRAFDKFDDTP